MKKAYYIDTYSTAHLHEMFDASSLVMFASMYDLIEYRASKSSYEHVLKLLGKLPENVHYKSIPVVNVNAKRGCRSIRSLLKQLSAAVINTFYVLTSKDHDVIINYNTPFALRFENWAAKRVKNKILQICHGEMLHLFKKQTNNKLFCWGMEIFRSSKVRISENFQFAVLGNAIKQNVIPLVHNNCRSKILSFDHTAIFDKIPLSNHIESKKLIVGVIGTMRESKGLSTLLEIGNALKDEKDIEVRITGKSFLEREKLRACGISIPIGDENRYLTRQEMYDQIRQLDFALFLFPFDAYRFTASGSVFDAIDCEIPIISLKNDYFDGLFKECGDFGYIEDNVDSLIRRIRSLSVHKTNTFDMKKVKKHFSPVEAGKRLKEYF